MHKIYTQAREIEKDPKQQDKYQDLLKQSDAIAAQAPQLVQLYGSPSTIRST